MELAMNHELVIPILLAYILTREVFFMINTHRLINKLMSRNLHEYELAQTVHRRDNVSKKSETISSVQAQEDGLSEDLGALTGMF